MGFAFAPTFSCGFPSFYRTVVLVAVLHSQCRGNVTREHAHTQSAQQRITFFIPQPLITEASQEDTDSRLRTSDILPTPSTDDWVGVGVLQQCRNGQTESFKQINGKSYIITFQTKNETKANETKPLPWGVPLWLCHKYSNDSALRRWETIIVPTVSPWAERPRRTHK